MVLPGEGSAVRRELAGWLDSQDIRPLIVAEVEDSALAKALGQAGVGLFVGPTVIEQEIADQYTVQVVGRVPAIEERYFAISLERRIKHPGVLAISSAARELLAR